MRAIPFLLDTYFSTVSLWNLKVYLETVFLSGILP